MEHSHVQPQPTPRRLTNIARLPSSAGFPALKFSSGRRPSIEELGAQLPRPTVTVYFLSIRLTRVQSKTSAIFATRQTRLLNEELGAQPAYGKRAAFSATQALSDLIASVWTVT